MDLKGKDREKERAAIFNFIAPLGYHGESVLSQLPFSSDDDLATFALGDKSERRYQKMYSKRSLIFFRKWTVARTGTEWDDAITVLGQKVTSMDMEMVERRIVIREHIFWFLLSQTPRSRHNHHHVDGSAHSNTNTVEK